MIMIKAIKDLYNNPEVVVANSLNQGFFVYVIKRDGTYLTHIDVDKIREKMNSIIRADIPIQLHKMRAEDAIKIWWKMGFDEKARLWSRVKPDRPEKVFELDGYMDNFYTDMLPSTGYYEVYDIRPYKHGLLLRNPTMLNPTACHEYRDDDKLYEAFAESKRMRKQYGLDYLADLNSKTPEEMHRIIKGSEKFQQSEINAIADQAIAKNKRLILIAGPSSSGKTTFAKKICKRITEVTGNEPLYLGTDDYFLNRADTPLGPDGRPNFEGLDALDLDLFNNQMNDLLAGKEVDIPEFDFMEGVKVFGKRITKLAENQTIVIEGIHSLNDELTKQVHPDDKFKIYISPLTRIAMDAHNRISTTDARLYRRIVRDHQFRNRDAACTITDWPKVREGENNNIFPYSSMADVVFNSSLIYETSMLKFFVKPLLQEVDENDPAYPEAMRLLEFINCFKTISYIEDVPADSILREFIGK